MAAGDAGEAAIARLHGVQFEPNGNQAVVEPAVVVAVVALSAVARADPVHGSAGALTPAVQVEQIAWIGRAVDLDVVVVEPVLRTEHGLKVRGDAGQVDQVDIGTTPLD